MKGTQLVDLSGLTADSRSNEQVERLFLGLEAEFSGIGTIVAGSRGRMSMRAQTAQSGAQPNFERITDCSYLII